MRIIHTFSSQKHCKISTIDLALWHMSCLCYRAQGYDLKIYCESKDLKFLEDNLLLRYYSEIDIGTFDKHNRNKINEPLYKVNGKMFWFIRKLVAINAEFEQSDEPFIYSDTDLFIFKPIDISDCDCLFWTLEKRDKPMSDYEYYCDWKYFSTPKNYAMPEYIKNTDNSNYNAGLVYFKDKELFKQYYEQVLNFIVGNPCKFTNQTIIDILEKTKQSISIPWSINAEQRILTGFVKEKKLNVKLFDNTGLTSNGISSNGSHYFILKSLWRQAAHWRDEYLSLDSIDAIAAMKELISFKNFFFRTLDENGIVDLLDMFKKKKLFKNVDRFETSMKESLKGLLK